MAVTGLLYGKVMLTIWNKELDFDTDTIKCQVHTSAHTPDQDVHDYKDDLTNEAAGGGYVAGGVTLASKTTTYTGATNKHALDAADPVFTNCPTGRYFIFIDTSPATDATRPLIGYQNAGADFGGVGGDVTLVLAAAGLVETTVS